MINAIKSMCFALLMIPIISSASPAENVFNGMVKTTEARGYKTAGGYAVGFGAASIRTPQVTFSSLYSIRPPSFRYGCNGIDFNLGAFSIINKDELVQQLRSIAQGTLMYAFGVAIDAMCSGCWSQMKEFAKDIQKHAQLLRGGCEKIVAEYGDDIQSTIKNNALVKGIRDTFESGTSEDAAQQYEKNDSKPVSETCGDSCSANYLYEFFKNSRYQGSSFIADTVAYGDKEFFEVFQSLIGNIVVDVSDGDNDQEGSISSYKPLTVEAFLNGHNPGEPAGTQPLLLKCENWGPADNQRCTKVKVERADDWKGVLPTIKELVAQLIEKYQNGDQRLEPEEIALATLFPMGQKGLTYLVKDKQATADISEHVAATVAAKVVLDTVRQYERAFEEITSKGTVKQIPREAIDRLGDNVKTMRDTAYKLEQEHAEGIRRANETISAILNIRNALGADK
jgi:hypothetical protein